MNQTRKVASWRGVKVAWGRGSRDPIFSMGNGSEPMVTFWQQVFFSTFISLCDLDRFAGFLLLLGDIFTME